MIKKKKKGFFMLIFSFAIGCLICKIIPVITEYILTCNSKQSHAEKLRSGYYDK